MTDQEKDEYISDLRNNLSICSQVFGAYRVWFLRKGWRSQADELKQCVEKLDACLSRHQ